MLATGYYTAMQKELEETVRALKKRRSTVERLIEHVEMMLAEPRIEDVFQRPFLSRVSKTLDELKNWRFVGSDKI